MPENRTHVPVYRTRVPENGTHVPVYRTRVCAAPMCLCPDKLSSPEKETGWHRNLRFLRLRGNTRLHVTSPHAAAQDVAGSQPGTGVAPLVLQRWYQHQWCCNTCLDSG